MRLIKSAAALLALTLIFSLTSCGGAGDTSSGSQSSDAESKAPVSSSDGKSSSSSSSSDDSSSASSESEIKERSPVYTNSLITKAMYTRSVVSEGNTSRLKAIMKKAQAGEPITVAAIGGSITYGGSASAPEKSYAALVAKWWEDAFPNTDVEFVNAGVGGTGSVIGAGRVEFDLLLREPDFVIVEFGVNDEATDAVAREAYEGIVRRILASPKGPAVMLLFLQKNDGTNAQEGQAQIGARYQLPMISYRDAMWPEMQGGKFAWKDVTADDIHPNDKGYDIVSGLVINQLEKAYRNMNVYEAPIRTLAQPVTPNRFMNAKYYNNSSLKPAKSDGWEKSYNAYWAFPLGWNAVEKNKSFEFETEGRYIVMIYKRTLEKKGGLADVFVDGLQMGRCEANVTQYEGYAMQVICNDYNSVKHHVSVTKIDRPAPGPDETPSPSDDSEFYILGFIIA